ncbi:MAG: IS21 family transposase [Planctomycetota bacterium]|jgi:transposase
MNDFTRNEIIRRWYEGQSMRGIAVDLHLARETVKRVVDQHRRDRQGDPAAAAEPRKRRPSKIDPYEDQIGRLLGRYPRITVQRILEELRREGYDGGYSILCERVSALRESKPAAIVQRFETGPGVQGQVDWSPYTIDFTCEGRRQVNLFGCVLSYSRYQYLQFTESQDMETTLRQHVRAFEHLKGVAATYLYDNMKTVVMRIEDGEPIYNPRFLAFATHYGFRPWACRVRRPQTKGKIERQFDYVEKSLLNGREFRSLEHLKEVTAWWQENVANVRVHRTTGQRPVDRHAEEQRHLIPLPVNPYEVAEMVYRTVDVEGFVSWRGNRYSVPWQTTRPGQMLPVKITEDELIVYGTQIDEIARHTLFPVTVTGQKREEKSHRPPRDQQRRQEALQQRFHELGDVAVRFLDGLRQSQRQCWTQAEQVLALSGTYHRRDLLAALERAVQYSAYSLKSVQRILAVQTRPKTTFDRLADESRRHLSSLLTDDPTPPRPAAEYQKRLAFSDQTHKQDHEQTNQQDDNEQDNGQQGNQQDDGQQGNQQDDGQQDSGQDGVGPA